LIHSIGGGRKIFLAATTKGVDLIGEGIGAALGLDESVRQRLAPAPRSDGLDEVGEPTLLRGEFALLELQRVRKVGAELGDLFFDSVENIGDVCWVGDLLADCVKNHVSARFSDATAAGRRAACSRDEARCRSWPQAECANPAGRGGRVLTTAGGRRGRHRRH
jgi:hypothetical protein